MRSADRKTGRFPGTGRDGTATRVLISKTSDRAQLPGDLIHFCAHASFPFSDEIFRVFRVRILNLLLMRFRQINADFGFEKYIYYIYGE